MIEKDDWRLSWHQDHLKGRTLRRISYVRRSDTNDHEHCEFCWSKFSEYEGDLREGYVSDVDGTEYWICPECFEDFKEMFGWAVMKA